MSSTVLLSPEKGSLTFGSLSREQYAKLMLSVWEAIMILQQFRKQNSKLQNGTIFRVLKVTKKKKKSLSVEKRKASKEMPESNWQILCHPIFRALEIQLTLGNKFP